uniref:Uncharacterized protein MANES_15G061400 n=1 Tax=Rhizophora mucronata TaxID=61149 RepID=A0A2P2MI74_RHIMU
MFPKLALGFSFFALFSLLSSCKMALNWFLNSAFTQVLGRTDSVGMQQHSNVISCPTDQECVQSQSLKDVAEEGGAMIVMRKEEYPNGFQVPLHYPRYKKADYEKMEDWKLDLLLNEYGLGFKGTLAEKRAFAMGTFLWLDQL